MFTVAVESTECMDNQPVNVVQCCSYYRVVQGEAVKVDPAGDEIDIQTHETALSLSSHPG